MKLNIVVLYFLVVSCASYQNGKQAKLMGENNTKKASTDILVTGSINDELSTKYFTYIQVEFGNQVDSWKDVSRVELDYKEKDLKIVLGPRLNDWGAAIKNKITVDRHNREMMWGAVAGVAAVGAVSSSSSGNYMASKTYMTVMAGAATASEVNKLSNKISDIERAGVFPTSHLYSPFSLPPGLVNKRWILLQHKEFVGIKALVFQIFLKNGEKRTYSIDLNPYNAY